MTSPAYTRFKGVSDFSETSLLTELEYNLKYYLDWALLSIGAWSNVTIQTPAVTDLYGGSPETLRFVHDDSYTDGQVWQSVRKDWVYESGVDYTTNSGAFNPINVMDSGISVSGTFLTTGFHINYPLGRVVFDNPIATGSTVQALYSYRNVQVYVADDAPWWKELQLRSWKADDVHFTQNSRTGDWSIGGHHRIQLPAIIIETIPRGRSTPYELGNTALNVEQDVLFHILADDRNMRNNLVSLLETQNDHVIWLWDTDTVVSGSAFPLDYRGERISGNVYPDIVGDTTYRYKKCYFTDINVSEIAAWHPRLYEGIVRATCEVVFGDV